MLDFSDEQIRALLAPAPDAALIVNRRGLIVFANAQAERLFGYSAADLIERPVEMLVPERMRAAHATTLAAFFKAPRARSMGERELVALSKDGREIPVEIDLNPIQSGEQQVVICAVRDISERRMLEQSLREAMQQLELRASRSQAETRQSQEHLRLFVEHAPAAVAMVDREMRYLLVSKRWLQDNQREEDAVIGRRHDEVFPDIPARWREAGRRCLAGERIKVEEDSVLRPDGKREWLRWELLPWRAIDGEIGGVLVFTEVITERKLAEQALLKSRNELEVARNEAVRADMFKTRLLSAASHDLRQPLQAADAYLNVLSRRIEAPELKQICEKARQPLNAMAAILDALLDISRLESGAIAVQVRDFLLDELLTRVSASNAPQAEQKALGFSVVTTRGCVVRTDPALLERIVDNFVSNAIRYTEAGEIRVGYEIHGDKVRLSVADTGIGIPDDALGSIFDEYVQLNNPERDMRKGLGFGLAIAKHIARLLDLPIAVTSTPGAGSTFSVEIPRGVGPAEDIRSAVEAPELGVIENDKPVVLFIDDDETIRDAMLMVFEDVGFAAKGAASGDEALALVTAGLMPDVIISDYRLPHYSGIEAIRRVREAVSIKIPAVLITGDMAIKTAGASDLEDCAVLHKPVDVDKLIALARQLSA